MLGPKSPILNENAFSDAILKYDFLYNIFILKNKEKYTKEQVISELKEGEELGFFKEGTFEILAYAAFDLHLDISKTFVLYDTMVKYDLKKEEAVEVALFLYNIYEDGDSNDVLS